MNHIKHNEKIPQNRVTSAPYNFVPLAHKILAGKTPPDFDRFSQLSGQIQYTIKTLTPVYTRCAYPPCENDKGKDTDKYQFFHHGNPEKPVVPGSTIRGMIRSLLTIMASGKLPECKDRQLFFRSFQKGVMGDLYTKRFSENIRDVNGPHGVLQAFKCLSEGGFLTQENEKFFFTPCHELRVSRKKLPISYNDLYHTLREGDKVKVPNPKYQYKEVWVQVERLDKDWRVHRGKGGPGMYTWRRDVNQIRIEKPDNTAGWHKGFLVITGDIPRKAAEFVFIPKKGAARIALPDEVISQVQDTDQISFWQERAFSKTDGKFGFEDAVIISDNTKALPIWMLKDKDKGDIIGIGRAQNFRLRFDRSTGKYVPEIHRRHDLDFVESLFGRIVKNPDKSQKQVDDSSLQIKSRIRFEDAACITENPFLSASESKDGYVVPQILSEPKPTAFHNYLKQPDPDIKNLRHYSNSGEIRGHKMYWHRNRSDKNGRKQLGHDEMFRNITVLGKQDTIIKPVRNGVFFTGMIKFDNLSYEELGALLSALELPVGYAHKVGMGKPLGMGSVRINVENIVIIDREKRYKSWDSGEISADEVQMEKSKAENSFRKVLIDHFNDTYNQAIPYEKSIWDLYGNSVLSLMLSWEDAPPPDNTRYKSLSGQDADAWRERKVLPTPHQVKNITVVSPESNQTKSENRQSVSQTAKLGDLAGTQTMRLLKNLGNNEWLAFHPDTEKEFKITKVKPSDKPVQDKLVEVYIRMRQGKMECTYIKPATVIHPDMLPDESKATANIVEIIEDNVFATITGGEKKWEVRSNKPGSDFQIGQKLSVRVIRRNGDYLALI
jgi:CRISPR-associated protein (TIGR03986 family)